MSAVLDLNALTKPIQLVVPQVATSTVTGTGIDISSYEGIASGVVSLGAASGTTATLIVTFEHSDTVSGTYTTLATASTMTDTSDNTVTDTAVDLRSAKAFVRAVGTIAGTTPSFAFSVTLEVTRTASLPV